VAEDGAGGGRAMSATSEKIALPNGVTQELYRIGSGKPLVFLHGVECRRDEDAVVAALAQRYTVVAPVTPGYADIADAAPLRDIHDLALHYDTLLETLGIDQAVLIGHSFGGMIAAEIAAHVPKRVARLVLIAPLGLWLDDYPVADLPARTPPEIQELLWRGAVARPAAPAASGDALERMIAAMQGLATVAKFTWPIPDKGLRRRLHRIAADTLVIVGEQDAYVPARYADDFVAGIPRARKLVWPGSHMVPYEPPDEVVKAIAEKS
jgi:pimeloyl-ACP methyl ester carboxylesterase